MLLCVRISVPFCLCFCTHSGSVIDYVLRNLLFIFICSV